MTPTQSPTINPLFCGHKKPLQPLDEALELRHFDFSRQMGKAEIEAIQQAMPPTGCCGAPDQEVVQNANFSYSILCPKSESRFSEAIVLLHGLNERSWEKYLPWAEALVRHTDKCVILFPIAFHMNRSPQAWTHPRSIQPWLEQRREQWPQLEAASFLNLALSSRLSEAPLRFYTSGRETLYNLWQLFAEIRGGMHPLFHFGSSLDIFAYSIGGLLSQIFLYANPDHLPHHSRLFIFCGGSIFSHMDGTAKDIMDREAFRRIYRYYIHDFFDDDVRRNASEAYKDDFLEHAFKMMIRPDVEKQTRETFFTVARERIRIVTLRQDSVMPGKGVQAALGPVAAHIAQDWDFPYSYSHQNPFPKDSPASPEALVKASFEQLFQYAGDFLA